MIKTYFITKPKKKSTTISPKASSGDLQTVGEAGNVVIEMEHVGPAGSEDGEVCVEG